MLGISVKARRFDHDVRTTAAAAAAPFQLVRLIKAAHQVPSNFHLGKTHFSLLPYIFLNCSSVTVTQHGE